MTVHTRWVNGVKVEGIAVERGGECAEDDMYKLKLQKGVLEVEFTRTVQVVDPYV